MEVVILGSTDRAGGNRQYVSSYLINQRVALDAGCLGLRGTPEQQAAVRHVLLTHAHADHTASLPFFLESVWSATPDCPVVYGSRHTLAALRRSLFNDEVWPDFVALSERMPPFVRFCPIEAEVPFQAAGLLVTPVAVEHAIPAFGYIIQEGDTAVVFSGDTAPTTRLWEVARRTPGVRAVFLEASFPNRLHGVAEASHHMTTEKFGREAAKTPPGSRIIAVHMKPRYHEEIIREIADLGNPAVEIGQCDSVYRF